MSDHIVVLSTAASADEASRIAHALVEKHLAACVNVVPGVASTYRWQGKVQTNSEWMMLVKTRRDLFKQVAAAIRELHSYEIPEVVMLEVAGGDPLYLGWLDDSLGKTD